jgi:hypothetical protein
MSLSDPESSIVRVRTLKKAEEKSKKIEEGKEMRSN